jgi:hypothetical protein
MNEATTTLTRDGAQLRGDNHLAGGALTHQNCYPS